MAAAERWQLYKLLAEPVRLRLLFLAGCEELSIGELADLLGEAQPNVSKHLAPLRRSDLLLVRKQGTRVFVRQDPRCASDPVVADAIATGRQLCAEDGSFARIAEVLRARELPTREFFARENEAEDFGRVADELPAYLTALSSLLPGRRLAIDIGTGAGHLLDLLAPLYERVLAVDREAAQLNRARERARLRGYANVEWHQAEFDDESLRKRVDALGGATAVFAARVLHHSPKPAAAIRALAQLLVPGGHVVIIDYAAHDDERLRDEQADLWLGFSDADLNGYAAEAGLSDVQIHPVPAARCGAGPDGHLDWLALVARVDRHL